MANQLLLSELMLLVLGGYSIQGADFASTKLLMNGFSPQLQDKIWEWPGNKNANKQDTGMGICANKYIHWHRWPFDVEIRHNWKSFL